ncbi:NAD+ synthase (glutamine-hydrolysing) [Geotoga petraea]|uniref:Glutamine-dependent NAD(+) synthetase n=2 Tax=Geotoga petraea TaxID=28234 RepID=A0A1G6IGZ8_9BACT|nr:NAD+ synthase [Geotoga petraea]SDC05680.1 NAD+ synthase (glutamine-hydrolysing) [Geotoga petraea]
MKMRISLAQMNARVGDYDFNYNKIIDFIEKAVENKSDIILFPELTLNGYPPEDLILKTQFLRESREYTEKIIEYSKRKNIIIIFGAIDWDIESYNSAFVVYKGRKILDYRKMFLPNYSVFDEKRYFTNGNEVEIFQIDDVKLGVNICEDIWVPNGPALALAQNGVNIILNLSASPYHKNKNISKLEMLKTRASELSSWLIYTNLVGGQDEVVFDGGSVVINPYGEVKLKAPLFEEGLYTLDIDPYETTRANLREGKRKHYSYNNYNTNKIHKIDFEKNIKKDKLKKLDFNWGVEIEQTYNAIKHGLIDYMGKNNFSKVCFGLSGGIDSALVAAIASEAIGKENVLGILMPSMYSSKGSVDDSIKLAKNYGFKTVEVPIKEIFDSFKKDLNKKMDQVAGLTEENIQARIRGTIVMAYSNNYGYLALATSNKSESAVGYSTLYGDMVGGFSPIKDLYKTEVYKMANFINEKEGYDIIPNEIIMKVPSAELKPDQKDQDSLPEYELLDKILFSYIDREMSFNELTDEFNEEIVRDIIKKVDINEFKRRQSAPGIKLTERSFGKDRRMPITNGFKIWEK